LFLTAGAVEQQTGTTDLDRLGSLSKPMPFTFAVCLIASLSISGIPPLNGFFSKWLIYQGLIEYGKTSAGFLSNLWIFWLIAAMFGSALTLASFMKIIHAIFLGKGTPASSVTDASFTMKISMGALALLCIAFGIFAYPLPIAYFLNPVLGSIGSIGTWSPGLATGLLCAALAVGFIIYRLSMWKTIRTDAAYIGGEHMPDSARITGTDFYNTVSDISWIKYLYQITGKKIFDIYTQSAAIIERASALLKRVHNGRLNTYVTWYLIGVLILLVFAL
jgi:NADH:ubiquinone oxidoreductase subunit 5 (subunit L)/multisubunit Na+/H+ antiporter MnhA subunit